MKRQKDPVRAGGIAFPALLGAISLILLYAACLMPTGLWGWVAIAGLGPLAAVASIGVRTGFLCWGGVSILALLLLPDKFCAVLFSLLFGLYPMIKAIAERGKHRVLGYGVKLVFFNLVLTLLLILGKTLMLASLPDAIAQRSLWVLYLLGNVIFLIYEIGLTRLIRFYLARVDRAIRKNGRFE